MKPTEKYLTCFALLLAAGVGIIMTHRIVAYPEFMTSTCCYQIGLFDSAKLGYVATRDFPTNHLIANGDLERPALPRSLYLREPRVTGRYLKVPVEKGAVVREENTRLSPFVEPAPNCALVAAAVSIEAVESGAIEAGARVRLLAGSHTVDGTVAAIRASGATRTALVQISGTDVGSFSSTDLKTPFVVVSY